MSNSGFKPGDYVETYSGDKGTVKSRLRNGQHLVQLGGMRVWLRPNQLRKIPRPFKRTRQQPKRERDDTPISVLIERELQDGKPSRLRRKDRTNNDYWGQGTLFASGQVWYHGTTKDFDTFETFVRPTFGSGMSEVPLFFSPSEKFARGYARGKNGKVFKVKLRWKKVFDGVDLIARDRYWPPQREDLTKEGQHLYDDLEAGEIFSGVDPDDWGVFGDSQGLWASILKNEYDVIETTEFKKWLSKNGYDAAYVTGDGEKNVFVFSPSQVKVLEVYPARPKAASYVRLAREVAQRWIQAVTTPLPSSLPDDEIALMTADEFIEHRNPQGKFHPSDTYQYDVFSLNKEHMPRVGEFVWEGSKHLFFEGKRGFLIKKEGELVGVLHGSVMYRTKWDRVPLEYRDFRGEWHRLEVKREKIVKYLDQAAALVSDKAALNLKRLPFVVRRFQSNGEYLTVRAKKKPETNAGVNLSVTNPEGQVVAVAQNEWGATLIAVADEYRGRRIGVILGQIWYELNPEYTSGGFTNSGYSNALKIWESRVREFLSRGWYSELIRQGKLDKRRLKEILSGVTGFRVPSRLPELPKKEEKPQLLAAFDGTTLVVYDRRFFSDPDEKYVYGFGLFRTPSVGTVLYRLDYDRKYRELVTKLALQAARDEGLQPVYVGQGYGDIIEYEGIPGVSRQGDYIELTRDFVDLRSLARMEEQIRKSLDPYGEKRVLLLEASESKSW